MPDNITTTAKTVIALFRNEETAKRAYDELLSQGFSHEQIGLIAEHDLSKPEEHVQTEQNPEGKVLGAVGKGLAWGGGLGAVAGGVTAMLLPGVGPLVIGGALASAFLGAGLGASVGGVMSGLMKAGVDESEARLFETALRHGGVVLTVHTDSTRAPDAVATLDRNGALDMDEHQKTWGDRGVDHVEGSTTGNRISDAHADQRKPE